MDASSRRLVVAVALALGLITLACGQEHQLPAGPSIPGSPSPSLSSSELPASKCLFPGVPSGSGVNGIYAGHSPFTLLFTSSGDARTVCLEIARQGGMLGGIWYVQGSCCEGGAINGTFDDAAGSSTFGKIKLRLPSIDFDLGLDAAVTSTDGSSFSGELGLCQNDDCSDRGPAGPVTFIRQ